MEKRNRSERFAVLRDKNRRMMNVTLLVALPGIFIVTLTDILSGHGHDALAVLLVGVGQVVILAAIGVLRLVARRIYRHLANQLFTIVLMTIVFPQILDIIVTDQERFFVFAACFLALVLFLDLPSTTMSVTMHSAFAIFSAVPLLLFSNLSVAVVLPTLLGIALIGMIDHHRQRKAVDTRLDLRRRKIRLHQQTRLYAQTKIEAKESEARYESVIDSMAEGVLILALDGRILTVNRSACRILSLQADAMIGNNIANLHLHLTLESGEEFLLEEPDASSGNIAKDTIERLPEVLGLETGASNDAALGMPLRPKKWLSVQARPLIRNGQAYAITVTFADITEQKVQADMIRHQAFHDPLTGLANRVLLQEALQLELAHAERDGSVLAVLYMDLDGFKHVNDSLGHTAGDELLVEVALRLQRALRRSDTLCRAGGDEFIAVLPGIATELDAKRVGDKILQALEEPCVIMNESIVLSASIGIAVFPENGRKAEDLLRNADSAMYAAKRAGRHAIRFFSTEMNEHARERFTMLSRLQRAVQFDELTLAFQPQLDLRTNTVLGAEALLRWNSEDGPVGPDVFIPLAEEAGLIHAIGDRVLHAALTTERALLNSYRGMTIAVNFSARQFAAPDLAARIEEAARLHGIPTSMIEVEITEGVMMKNQEIARQNMIALNGLGMTIAIDDFGTGYSSLAYLKNYPIDILKIDRAFVREIPANAADMAILVSIVGVAKALGIRTVAEGVETQEQADVLKGAGCDVIQGYWFARPMPFDDFLDFSRRHNEAAERLAGRHIFRAS